MTRRGFLSTIAGSAAMLQMQAAATPVKLGIDLFSIRSQNWTPFQYLDYCAAQKVQVVHFSEVRFIGGLEPANLKRVREYARPLGIELEIGMKSICPASKMFDAKDGKAEDQLAHMIVSAQTVGSRSCAVCSAAATIAKTEGYSAASTAW